MYYGNGWICNKGSSITGWTNNPTVEHLNDVVNINALKIIPLYSKGYYNYISSKSFMDIGVTISTGSLEIGKKYRVVSQGTTDLTTQSGYISPAVNTIFICLSATAPFWDGTTSIIEQYEVTNSLIKQEDVDNRLNHSFGISQYSPICTLVDGGIRVYFDNTFDINSIVLEYIRKPNSVSKDNSIDCDLPESIHETIVDLTVSWLSGTLGTQEYQTLKMESEQAKQTIK